MKSFHRLYLRALKADGRSQNAIADAAGVSRMTASRFKNGHDVCQSSAAKLLTELGCKFVPPKKNGR